MKSKTWGYRKTRVLKQLPYTLSLIPKDDSTDLSHLVNPIECVECIRPQFIQVEVVITEGFLIDYLIKAR